VLGALQECQSAAVDESFFGKSIRTVCAKWHRVNSPHPVRSEPRWAEPTNSRHKKISCRGKVSAFAVPATASRRRPAVNHTDRVPGLLRLASLQCVREVLFGPGSKFGNRAETATTQCRRLPCVPPCPAKCLFSRFTKLKGS
jgi:hypothetical protein